MTTRIKVENTYEDGHESTFEYDVEDTDGYGDIEDWWDEVAFEHTGDGHGTGDNSKLGCFYEVTIIQSPHPEEVGLKREWD
jgi:hypothetical protein